MRSATTSVQAPTGPGVISIHALHAERDPEHADCRRPSGISIHALHAERDGLPWTM